MSLINPPFRHFGLPSLDQSAGGVCLNCSFPKENLQATAVPIDRITITAWRCNTKSTHQNTEQLPSISMIKRKLWLSKIDCVVVNLLRPQNEVLKLWSQGLLWSLRHAAMSSVVLYQVNESKMWAPVFLWCKVYFYSAPFSMWSNITLTALFSPALYPCF